MDNRLKSKISSATLICAINCVIGITGVAAEQNRVALITDDAETPMVRRIAAELTTLGVAIEWVPLGEGDNRYIDLDQVAAQFGTTAAIRILVATGEVDLWTQNRATQSELSRRVRGAEGEDDAALVVRAVEMIRACFLPVDVPSESAAPPPVSDSTPEATQPKPSREPSKDDAVLSTRQTAAPEPKRLSLAAGPAVLAPGFDFAPTVNIAVSLHLRVFEKWGLAALGVVPLIRTRVEPAAASSDAGIAYVGKIDTGLAGGAIRFSPLAQSSRWQPTLAVGFAALFFKIAGETTSATDSPQVDFATVGSPLVNLGLRLAVTARFRLCVELLGGWALRPTELRRYRTDEQIVTTLGPLWLSGTIGVDLLIF